MKDCNFLKWYNENAPIASALYQNNADNCKYIIDRVVYVDQNITTPEKVCGSFRIFQSFTLAQNFLNAYTLESEKKAIIFVPDSNSYGDITITLNNVAISCPVQGGASFGTISITDGLYASSGQLLLNSLAAANINFTINGSQSPEYALNQITPPNNSPSTVITMSDDPSSAPAPASGSGSTTVVASQCKGVQLFTSIKNLANVAIELKDSIIQLVDATQALRTSIQSLRITIQDPGSCSDNYCFGPLVYSSLLSHINIGANTRWRGYQNRFSQVEKVAEGWSSPSNIYSTVGGTLADINSYYDLTGNGKGYMTAAGADIFTQGVTVLGGVAPALFNITGTSTWADNGSSVTANNIAVILDNASSATWKGTSMTAAIVARINYATVTLTTIDSALQTIITSISATAAVDTAIFLLYAKGKVTFAGGSLGGNVLAKANPSAAGAIVGTTNTALAIGALVLSGAVTLAAASTK